MRSGIKMIPTQQLELEDIGDPKYADGFPPAVMAHGDFIWFRDEAKAMAVH